MQKAYTRHTWHNGQTPALNETNLNEMEVGIDTIDTRLCEIAADVYDKVPEIQTDLAAAKELKTACQTSATAAAGSATEAKGYAQQAAAGSGGNALEYTNNVLKLKRDSTVLSQVTISGGSGGTTDYTQLSNKPSINSVTLSGNKTGADFNLANAADVTSAYSNIYGISNAYNASTSYAPDDSEKPSMCIDENELYKCLVACQGIKPSTDTSGSWEKVTLAAMLSNFQNGVSTIYNSIVARGLTPNSQSPTDCAEKINYLTKIHYTLCGYRANTTSYSNATLAYWLNDTALMKTSNNITLYTNKKGMYRFWICAFTGRASSGSVITNSARVLVNGSVILQTSASDATSYSSAYSSWYTYDVDVPITFQIKTSASGSCNSILMIEFKES